MTAAALHGATPTPRSTRLASARATRHRVLRGARPVLAVSLPRIRGTNSRAVQCPSSIGQRTIVPLPNIRARSRSVTGVPPQSGCRPCGCRATRAAFSRLRGGNNPCLVRKYSLPHRRSTQRRARVPRNRWKAAASDLRHPSCRSDCDSRGLIDAIAHHCTRASYPARTARKRGD
jgi:hypothetical protein